MLLYKFLLRILFFYIYFNSAYADVKSLCKKCYCEEMLIDSIPEIQVQCTFMNINEIFNENLNDVYELDVSHNKIVNLSTNKVNCINLRILKLSYNKISMISSQYFTTTPNLTVLDLSHNELKNLESNTFDNLQNLRVLNLKFNSLTQFPANLFTPLINLHDLDLGYNEIASYLVSDNNILAMGLNQKLTHMKLNGVGFKTIPNNYFDIFPNLEEICLADNYLNQFPILPNNIKHLDVSGNNFSEITVKDLLYQSLKSLKLNRLNNLKRIHHYAFYNLLSLEELFIENCPKLREFSDVAFEDIENGIDLPLKQISLKGCGLETLNKTYFHLFTSLRSINLLNNPWKCSCDIFWLQFLRKKTIVKHEHLMCRSPLSPTKKNIMEISFETCTVKNSNKLQRIIVPVLIVLIILLLILIMYLCYLNPLKYGEFPLGPQSPYQRVVQI